MRACLFAAVAALAVSTVALPPVVAGPLAPIPMTAETGASGAVPVENVKHSPWHRVQRDCHRTVRRHYVRGYGRVWHRHVGPRCRVQLVRRDHHRDNCIHIGDVRICF